MTESFTYKGWVLDLESLTGFYIYHQCQPGIISSTWVNIEGAEPDRASWFSECRYVCKNCYARITDQEAQVLRAAWTLFHRP